MYDLIIIGGGPAGAAGGVYASRKRLKTLLITESFGGQSAVSTEIQNWIGTVAISGEQLAKAFEDHLKAYAEDIVTIEKGEWVAKLESSERSFRVTTTGGKVFEGKTVLITSGANRRQLEVPGAAAFDQKGLTYCASCDGPLFAGQDVAVVGAGNAGFETAVQLLAYTKSVTLLTRGSEFRADPVTVEKVLAHPHMKAVKNTEIMEVKGDKFVNGLVYKDKTTGKVIELPVTGVFVEIGLLPNTDFAKGIVETDKVGRIVVNAKNQRASVSGIWAAGDCTDELYHQNNIAAGDAVKALEDIYLSLKAR